MSELSHRAWAWEFLRRNPRYRAVWEDWTRLDSAGANWSLDEPDSWPESFVPTFRRFAEFGVSTPVDPARSAAAVDASCRVPPPLPPPGQAARPCEPERIDFRFWRRELLSGNVFALNTKHATPEEHLRDLPPTIALLGFDLSKPIKPQLRQAGEILSRLREHNGTPARKSEIKTRLDLYPTYLRLLDADNAGWPQKIMAADVLGLDLRNENAEKRAGEMLSQARRLCESGYRALVGLD